MPIALLPKTDSDHVLTIVCTGDLTATDAPEVKQVFADALAGERPIVVDTFGMTGTDVTFLQVLCAAHREATERKMPLSLAEPLGRALIQACEDGGLPRQRGCVADSPGGCLWVPLNQGGDDPPPPDQPAAQVRKPQ